MKKNLFILFTLLAFCLNAFSQATSLTVDCQTPGWLSSKINYGDQQTLKDIKVTGYLNGTDIKFIRELNLNRNLNGCIDLEDANIVAGGDSYGGSDNYISVPTTTKDNILTQYMFAYLNPIRKVILPKSLTGFSCDVNDAFQFIATRVDTLVINGSMKSLTIGGGHDNKFWGIQCIYFPKELESIDFQYFTNNRYQKDIPVELYLPDSLKIVTSNKHCIFNNGIFHCYSPNPESIKVTNFYGANNQSFFEGGTIYIPAGMKSNYENSIFSKLNIIEEIFVESIEVEPITSILYVGKEYQLQSHVNPINALDTSIMWSSSDESIATVSSDGVITAKKAGEVVVTASSSDGKVFTDIAIRIYDHTTGVTISKESLTMNLGATETLSASTLPLETSDGKVKWKSADERVAIVNDKGTVVAVGYGTTVIIVTSVDGDYVATCTVQVTEGTDISTPKTIKNKYKIYDLNGIEKRGYKPGINILKFDDGTTKKTVIKK